ncbi:SAM-dependent methyltransferase [Neiella marina]|uniref:tRNA (guanine(46)-N(7))-methyltransferase n=1 Tax=Neiella holothuriorum TaxID=2870530 RepID=A0ABS7EGP5_9GAMM|nr:SAM-dependent methyltransferase [Neiella holothuriorum]MBW8191093.1 SAM-dependent methyltransferase [Neiella holothuriorum]
MTGDSKQIVSNQVGVHEHLNHKVERHLLHPFQKPIAAHTQHVFDELNDHVKQWQGPVILDACCGVGESSQHLAAMFPDALVVGIDKSACRISKGIKQEAKGRYVLARADLNDLWRLIWAAQWPVTRQYILYPNPWPKSEHLGRRWHGAGVFPYILATGGILTVRSNWPIYVAEFAEAVTLAGLPTSSRPFPQAGNQPEPITPFERKYWLSGHSSTELEIDLTDYHPPAWLVQTKPQLNNSPLS